MRKLAKQWDQTHFPTATNPTSNWNCGKSRPKNA